MRTIHVKGHSIERILTQLKDCLGGTIIKKTTESILNIDNDIADGEVKGFPIGSGISYLELNIRCKEGFVLNLQNIDSDTFHFIYASNGVLSHFFDSEKDKSVLNTFQTTIIKSASGTASSFCFSSNVSYTVSFIYVNTEFGIQNRANGEDLLGRLRSALNRIELNKDTVYLGSYNLKIGAKIQEINGISKEGIVKTLFAEGIVNTILGMFIEQFEEDLNATENQTGSLSQKEMEAISDMSTFIKNYPDIQYTLKYLSLKTGISPSKLQEGFKLLHNRTVTDYIRNIRIEAAEHLIKTTEMNISEIVYSIGLTSRSYFSKIFKEKYNCSPKYYQENQNALAVTA